ncbi:YraN family protein [bacterium]|nr:YraN family protein [bacterium]
MGNKYLQSGKDGEKIAVNYLRRQKYKIICENYCTKLGEIDIIARDEETVVFVEVKYRASDWFGFPLEAIDKRKQNQIAKSALCYVKEKNIAHTRLRFDVVAICGDTVELIKNAFLLDERYIY